MLYCAVYSAFSSPAISQHTPQTTYEGAPSTPAWATLMYESPEDYEGVRSGYEDWRKENPGVKNQHSQYYKRWIRKHISQVQTKHTLQIHAKRWLLDLVNGLKWGLGITILMSQCISRYNLLSLPRIHRRTILLQP